ncbi:aminotransferase [Streptomyces eurocidicus]|uniref:Aminotransferase n=1 Tax=Streptomyces eurocidicus TaxID=66423 RepID=A0A2N8NUG4_STREU|nr:aminotransferase class V-fold PLP-dependent enzyme [Streptomyces eurocidicus]MBB5120257.1 selenocysteine lyase/cysteine desulfurase [Streptomyces eurocidicus]MBF6056062.1 aminotransferase class V-fold PLP-dependent enzyme [Streptomyces eurocidicus]PNE32404.1 aminotransferase [Streptomyces eurocidicus]
MSVPSDGHLLPCSRHLFDVPDHVAYFNVASLAPTLRTGLAAGHDSMRLRAQPWKIGADGWFTAAEQRRALFAALIGACADEIALISATSYGMATAAKNLTARPGQRVLVLADEYPSGIYTWWRFTERTGAGMLTVARRPGQTWTEAVLDALDERVAVVSVPQVHWTDGALLDLEKIAEAARAAGAALVIDASQSAGAMPLDVAALQPDFLVTVGYKWLLGPFGLGYLYVAPAHHDGLPLEENWIVRQDSQNFARLVDYRTAYQPGARRFDMGQRTAFELTPMATAALEQLTTWTVPKIAATLNATTARIAAAARERGLAVSDPRGPHMLGIDTSGRAPQHLLTALGNADVHASVRGAALRISPHLHTSKGDIDKLITALDSALGR